MDEQVRKIRNAELAGVVLTGDGAAQLHLTHVDFAENLANLPAIPVTATSSGWGDGTMEYQAEAVVDLGGGQRTMLRARLRSGPDLDLRGLLTETNNMFHLSIVNEMGAILTTSAAAKPQLYRSEFPATQTIAPDTWTMLANEAGWVMHEGDVTLTVTLTADGFTADGPVQFSRSDPEAEWDES